jgi:hypothetical protein
MHPLINEDMVALIRATGKTIKTLPDREEVLDQYGLPYDRDAETVIITGCQILSTLPEILSSLARVLDLKGRSYTFLSKEYCCGNYLYRPAVKAKDETALSQCRDLSKEFLAKNLDRARQLGARRLAIFCSPCYPIYKHAFPDEDIVFYPAILSELIEEIPFDAAIDYYAGCYKLHERLSPAPMDLESTEGVFGKLQGLEVNRIDAPKCCFSPEGLSHMVGNVRTNHMVHICTGCYGRAQNHLPPEKGVEVLMLPELVEKAIHQQKA